MLSDGPAASFIGSPTVSPSTATVWSSEPGWVSGSASIHLRALSHASPALVMKSASRIPDTVAPTSTPPSASVPSAAPTITGTRMAMAKGTAASRSDACVAMSTQRAESGWTVPSISPGISANWRRDSAATLAAVRPTAARVSAPTKKGTPPPSSNPSRTKGWIRSIDSSRTAEA